MEYAGKAAALMTATLSAFTTAYANGIEWSSQTGAWTSTASGAGKKTAWPRTMNPCPAARLCASFE